MTEIRPLDVERKDIQRTEGDLFTILLFRLPESAIFKPTAKRITIDWLNWPNYEIQNYDLISSDFEVMLMYFCPSEYQMKISGENYTFGFGLETVRSWML